MLDTSYNGDPLNRREFAKTTLASRRYRSGFRTCLEWYQPYETFCARPAARTLSGPSNAGIHRVNWDLKRQNKVSEADAVRAGVTTISEREALDWVLPGTYNVTLTMGTSLRKTVVVRKESDGVKVGSVRK